jgi:hypothetical protein
MAVNNTHKQYDAYRWRWRRCRDVIAGRDSVLQNGRQGQRFQGSLYDPVFSQEIYLPRLSGQSESEYRSYAERAAFFNASGRTLDALTGLIFAKNPQMEFPPAIERFSDDITLAGDNLREFSEQIVEEQIAVGRVGIMVDYPADVPSSLSVAAAEALNIRPFMRLYKAETILNWRVESIGGVRVLTMVVLQETHDIREDDFTTLEVTRYRVLDLTEQGYRVRVMTQEGATVSETYPLMRGRPLQRIPFIVLGANSSTTNVQKPPLLDLIDANIAHYRNSADYEHGLHFTGLPTPYVAGVQLDEGQTLNLGSKTAWVFPDPSAKAAFLEFTGQGLSTIREAMKDKESRMAALGARFLSDDKRSAEAFQTLELRTSGERANLASISRAASDAITRALNIMAAWVGAPETARYSLNTEYVTSAIAPAMMQQLLMAYQTGAMPLSILFENMQKGEIVSDAMTFESYQAQLDDAGPSMANDDEDDAPPIESGTMAAIRARLGL